MFPLFCGYTQKILPDVGANPLYFNNGKVGVGVSNPSQMLDVNGNVSANSYRVSIPVGYTGYSSYFSSTDVTGKYKFYLGSGTAYGPGSGWFPVMHGCNYDNWPFFILVLNDLGHILMVVG